MSQQINLFNDELLGKGKSFSGSVLLKGLGIVVFCLGLLYAYFSYQVLELQDQLAETGKNLAAEQSSLASVSQKKVGLTIEQELKIAEAEAVAQREIINALKSGVIGNTRGYSEYMRAFAKQSLGGLWLTGFNIDGDATTMTLSGAALNPELVPAYIQRLNHEKIMRGKTFASLQMQLPKTEVGKSDTAQYLEFTLLSTGVTEEEKK